jgi:hypothetical protein
MSPVTEIATLFLKAGIDLEDPSSLPAKAAQEAFNTISSQPGFQRIYYGPELEDSSILQLFIGASHLNCKSFLSFKFFVI